MCVCMCMLGCRIVILTGCQFHAMLVSTVRVNGLIIALIIIIIITNTLLVAHSPLVHC